MLKTKSYFRNNFLPPFASHFATSSKSVVVAEIGSRSLTISKVGGTKNKKQTFYKSNLDDL